MAILAQTEYQDLYRVTDGVLVVVNKFRPIDYGLVIGSLFRIKVKSYNKGCQKQLQVLKEDYYHEYADITIPKGTVLYNCRPVEMVEKQKWTYQIKTTGDLFSGNYDEILELLSDIVSIIKTT